MSKRLHLGWRPVVVVMSSRRWRWRRDWGRPPQQGV